MSERQRTVSVRLSDDDLRGAAGAPPGATVSFTAGYSDPRDPRDPSPGYVTVTWTEKAAPAAPPRARGHGYNGSD